MPSVNDLLAPFRDVFFAKVDGTIFGINGTQKVVKVFYWFAVLFGCFVFIGGIISTGIDLDDLVTKTEILPMVPTVNYPVIWGCVPDSVGNSAGFETIAADFGSECGAAAVGCPASGWYSSKSKIGGYGDDDANTKFSELKILKDLANDPTAPFYEQEKRAKALMAEMMVSLGAGFSNNYCFVTNYDQAFKPSYDKKTRLSVNGEQHVAVHDEDMYSVMGFFEEGSTKATQSSFGYAGYQNAMMTIGMGIDEEVDAKGMSYAPKTKGTKKEVYTMNTAITTGRYAENLDGAQVSVKDGTGGNPDRSLRTQYSFYMDTFVRRRTTIRNKSFSEIFAELGASFAASMIFISILFKAGPENSQVFRFCDTRPQAIVQDIKASTDAAEVAAPIAANGVQGMLTGPESEA